MLPLAGGQGKSFPLLPVGGCLGVPIWTSQRLPQGRKKRPGIPCGSRAGQVQKIGRDQNSIDAPSENEAPRL